MPLFIAGLSIFTSFLLFLFWIWGNIFSPFVPENQNYSTLVYDQSGHLLSFTLSDDDFYRLPPADFSDISFYFLEAVIAIEDDNFFAHGAVDVPATARAFVQNLVSGRVVSGASTLSQQLAKKILGNVERTFTNKIREICIAFSLEKNYSKEEIFALWSNMAPFSSNITGVSAASMYFFHKPARELSLAQSAYLAGIPKNPSRFSPFQFPEVALQRQKFVLNAMREKDFISHEEYQHALAEEIFPALDKPEKQAHHFSRFAALSYPNKKIVHSSLSLPFQEKVEYILSRHLGFLEGKNAKNAAAVVIENETGAVLAYVGNTSDEVDILRSYRQVGSTLKPFLYLLAFEHFNYTAETIVFDEPIAFETALGNSFEPKNFDLQYKGEITVAEALAESRNIPAVSLLKKIGEKRFLRLLKNLDISFLQSDSDAGLSLALGAAEIRPIDLAKAYVVLAREGKNISLCTSSPCFSQQRKSVLSLQNALKITHILADNTARVGAFGENSELLFPFAVAAKTGTTRNFNDNYVVGFSPEHTVLVWVGNTDGGEMREVSGISGAGPIFHDIFSLLPTEEKFSRLPSLRKRELQGVLKTAGSSARDSTEEERDASSEKNSLRILSPLNNQVFQIDSSRPAQLQKIKFETTKEGEFFLHTPSSCSDSQYSCEGEVHGNGSFMGAGKKLLWIPQRGEYTLYVISKQEKKEISFSVE